MATHDIDKSLLDYEDPEEEIEEELLKYEVEELEVESDADNHLEDKKVDYALVRKVKTNTINKLNEAVNDMLVMGKQIQHPEAYKTLAKVADILGKESQSLLDIHDNMEPRSARGNGKNLPPAQEQPSIENNTQNNIIVNGNPDQISQALSQHVIDNISDKDLSKAMKVNPNSEDDLLKQLEAMELEEEEEDKD